MLHIHRASPDDLDGMELVEGASFEVNRFERDVLHILISEEDFHSWVAEIDGEMVGYAAIADREDGHVRLVSIAVIPSRREQGVGRELLRRVRGHAAARNCGRISLEVRMSNVPAINLYLSSGYRIKGILKDYYSKGSEGPEDALYMILDLDDG